MPVTEISAADRSAIFAEVERLTESSLLHGSEALCRLLRYLAEQYFAHPGLTVKEYQLATEVFGRPADFDPRMDSTVRVQTGRLRSKVAEYYASAGSEDPIILEIPKGSYSLAFHYRPAAVAPLSSTSPASAALPVFTAHPLTPVLTPPGSKPRVASGWIVFAGLATILIIGLAAALFSRNAWENRAAGEPVASESIRRFWRPFTQTPDRPWIIFSNAEFVGRPQDGIRYFDPRRDSRADILDHYTGVGEVLGVAELSRVFAELHHEIKIKRGRLLALDDVKSNDVIFLGSSAENLTLREIPTTQEFVFRRIEKGPRNGDTELVNVHPRAGEPAEFLASANLPVVEDYGLIGLSPGINPARWILVLAGTTTMGTQAAAEFVSRESTLKSLVDQLPARDNAIEPFEAVIRVHISGGVPVSSTIVALHVGRSR
jgi:hypothetical protein